jgi:hypothetical protein
VDYRLSDKEARQLVVMLRKLWGSDMTYSGGLIHKRVTMVVEPEVYLWIKAVATARNIRIQMAHAFLLREAITLYLKTEADELGFDAGEYAKDQMRAWMSDHPKSDTK